MFFSCLHNLKKNKEKKAPAKLDNKILKYLSSHEKQTFKVFAHHFHGGFSKGQVSAIGIKCSYPSD